MKEKIEGLQYSLRQEDVRTADMALDILQKTDKPAAAHFNLPDHSLDDLQLSHGIEKIHNNGMGWRKHRESYWIFTLDTMAPAGINLED